MMGKDLHLLVESVLSVFFGCLLVVKRNDLLCDFSFFSLQVVDLPI